MFGAKLSSRTFKNCTLYQVPKPTSYVALCCPTWLLFTLFTSLDNPLLLSVSVWFASFVIIQEGSGRAASLVAEKFCAGDFFWRNHLSCDVTVESSVFSCIGVFFLQNSADPGLFTLGLGRFD